MLKEDKAVYIRNADADVDSKGHMFLKGDRPVMEPAHDSILSILKKNDVSAR